MASRTRVKPRDPSEARFLLLDGAVATSKIDTMLGTVVRDPTRPRSHMRPNLTDPSITETEKTALELLLKSLYEREDCITMYDIETMKDYTSNRQVRTKFSDLLTLYGKRVTKKDITVTAGIARRYEFDGPGTAIGDKLLKNSTYKKQLEKMIGELRRAGQPDMNRGEVALPMITGILTCEQLSVKWNNDKSTAAGFAGKVPVGKLAGNPAEAIPGAPSADVSIEIDSENSTSQTTFATIKGEVIFAIAYDQLVIELKHEKPLPGLWTRLWNAIIFHSLHESPDLVADAWLGGQISGPGFNVMMSDDSSDDERIDDDDVEKGKTSQGSPKPRSGCLQLYYKPTDSISVSRMYRVVPTENELC